MHGPSSVVHDLRHAIRLFRNNPGFSAVATATIALAIGANTAMFSFVNGLLLSPLPYPESDRIVRVLERLPSGGLNGVSTLNYLDWTNQTGVFEYMAAEAGWRATLTGRGEPVVIQGARVSPHYFDIFGVKAASGRLFLPGEDQPGHDRVVVLNHLLWDTRFGADPAVLGRPILLDGQPHTVVGILPKGGPFDRAAARIWKPLAFEPADMTRDFRWLGASARLEPSVTLGQAQAAMRLVGQRLARTYPDSNRGWSVAVDRLADVLIGPQLRTAVVILFAATTFVLLIGCANLANLALARAMARRGGIAVRAVLGASRRRLIQQMLIEHLVIAACGGIAGIGVGYAMLAWIQSLIPPSTLPAAVDISIDTSVLLFTLTAVVVTGLLCGAVPAAQMTNPSLAGALTEAGHRAAGSPGRRVRGGLVVAEIGLAFVLLAASGLLVRSFLTLLDVDLGFDAADVVTAGLPVTPEQHPDPVELNAYLASIRAAVDAVPGVHETAITSALPLQGWGYGVPYAIADRTPVDETDRRRAFFKIVSPSYFDALGIRLLAGRTLSERDRAGGPRVAVVNETLARREFPDEDPIGRRLLVPELVPGKTGFGEQVAWEIVGVVAGEKVTGLGDEISAGMYVSNEQSPSYAVNLVVRSAVPLQPLRGAMRSAIDRVNSDQALSDVRLLAEIVNGSMLATRVTSTILAVFASMALVLAALGTYGVVSLTAVQRTHEMGIRAALGASAGNQRRLIFEGGMRLVTIGLATGLAGSFVTTRVLSSMLFGIGADDPVTMGIAAAVLVTTAGLACFVPAWRITHADPMAALRHQ